MGCYGIGIGRIMAAVAEQNNDEFGLIWPLNIAPYKVALVLINEEDAKQKEKADYLYDELSSMGISVIYDNRLERPGVKFNDMDLIGIPIRVTVGKKINDNIVELKLRNKKEIEDVDVNEIISKIQDYCINI